MAAESRFQGRRVSRRHQRRLGALDLAWIMEGALGQRQENVISGVRAAVNASKCRGPLELTAFLGREGAMEAQGPRCTATLTVCPERYDVPFVLNRTTSKLSLRRMCLRIAMSVELSRCGENTRRSIVGRQSSIDNRESRLRVKQETPLLQSQLISISGTRIIQADLAGKPPRINHVRIAIKVADGPPSPN
jgi:hypothetical protein